MATYHVENFGCRATQADGAALDRQFQQRGLDRAPSADADLVILNTCTVTAAADQDARAAIRRTRRHNPNAKIVVTGCYAQRAPEELAALPGVSFVVGNSHKHQLADIALQEFGMPEGRPKDQEGHDFSRAIDVFMRPNSAAGVDGQESRQTFVPLSALSQNSGSPELEAGSRLFVSDIFAHTELLGAPVFEGIAASSHADQRTRPNLKVQDGCDNRCSFCVIPYVRGRSRSLPLDEVLREVNALVTAGYREVVISGINLGRWGRDLDPGPQPSDRGRSGFRLPASGLRRESRQREQTTTSTVSDRPRSEARGLRSEVAFRKPGTGSQAPTFESLIRAILADTSLEKLRISSVEPMDWSDELIRLVATSPRIAKHAHVPLQSGSDAVLRRMHRKYRPWHYREKIEKIRAALPTAAIGADVMVGFPGETDAEFEATRRLIEDLPFTYLHVFTYSARPGTPAADLPNQVPVHIARERNRILRDLAEEKKGAFMRSFIGETVDAITLGSSERFGAGVAAREGAATEALTDNYLKVHLKGHHESNQWIKAEVKAVEASILIAEPR
ncbi:MAG: radical SAM protein [Candidatus Sulfotelmatobacter sp.]